MSKDTEPLCEDCGFEPERVWWCHECRHILQPIEVITPDEWLDIWYALAEEYGEDRADDLGQRLRDGHV